MAWTPAAEIERLKIENEELKAKLILAKASTAARRSSSSIGGWWRDVSPAEQQARHRDWHASFHAKLRALGFDPSTEQGRQAYFAAAYRRARGEPEPATAAPIAATLDGTTIQATIGVERRPAPPASDDPLAVYLPPPTVATPAAIERAVAIAEGRLVELPTDPVARAIIAADRKAGGESEHGEKPL